MPKSKKRKGRGPGPQATASELGGLIAQYETRGVVTGTSNPEIDGMIAAYDAMDAERREIELSIALLEGEPWAVEIMEQRERDGLL